MKYRIMAAIVLVWTAVFLQSTLLEYIEIFSVRPNLLIVLTVIVALLRSPVESAVMGLFLGLAMDILMGKILGWNGLLFMLITIPISLVNEKLYREKVLVLLTFTFTSTVLIETLFFLIMYLFKDLSYFPKAFVSIILIEAIYNSILILPLFKPISGVYTILDTLDRKRNRLSS